MEKKHRKHAKLAKPTCDHWAKKDIGVFGSDCSVIESFCGELADALALNVIYVDTDHGAFDNPSFSNQSHSSFAETRIETATTSSFHTSNQDPTFSTNKLKHQLALVNANHFEVERTILLYSEHKKQSILKRTHQLNACFIVVLSDDCQLPKEIEEKLPASCTLISTNDRSTLHQQVHKICAPSKINGLVLAGGKSTRMGQDKSILNLHGEPQFEYLAKMLDAVCDEVFISVSENHTVTTNRNLIFDKFKGLGPYAAILSAFQEYPDAAWLVLASDLPNVTPVALRKLTEERSPSKLATAFLNSATGFPDPLCTLWEPSSYPRLLEFLALGYSCPRKVLINSSVKIIEHIDQHVLFNMNTPKDLEQFRKGTSA